MRTRATIQLLTLGDDFDEIPLYYELTVTDDYGSYITTAPSLPEAIELLPADCSPVFLTPTPEA